MCWGAPFACVSVLRGAVTAAFTSYPLGSNTVTLQQARAVREALSSRQEGRARLQRRHDPAGDGEAGSALDSVAPTGAHSGDTRVQVDSYRFPMVPDHARPRTPELGPERHALYVPAPPIVHSSNAPPALFCLPRPELVAR